MDKINRITSEELSQDINVLFKKAWESNSAQICILEKM